MQIDEPVTTPTADPLDPTTRPPSQWLLYRLDDNGNRILMQRFDSLEEASRMAEWYTAKGHKQTYEVEQEPDR